MILLTSTVLLAICCIGSAVETRVSRDFVGRELEETAQLENRGIDQEDVKRYDHTPYSIKRNNL